MPMFDRDTGDVDPAVIAYWHDHYDLANIVQKTWAQRGPQLRGRIHVFVGTADTFYLDGAAHKMEAVLKALNADAHFTYIPDRTHFDLYTTYATGGDPKGDRLGLFTTDRHRDVCGSSSSRELETCTIDTASPGHSQMTRAKLVAYSLQV